MEKEKKKMPKWLIVVIAIFAIAIVGSTLLEEDKNNNSNNSSSNNNNSEEKSNYEKEEVEKKNEVTVIDFSKMSYNDIVNWCEENKIECNKKEAHSNNVAKGKFVSQSVKNGETIYEGEEIDFIYSLGKEASLSQKNAIKKAESYLDYSAFSREGLIAQLEFEQFSKADATYAVDNITVDWNEQAHKKAQSYLDYSSFSRNGLIDQLIFEKFTRKQAEYAVNKVGL